MAFRLLDLIIGINASIGIIAYVSARIRRGRRERNIERIRQLEEENKEIDEFLEKNTKGRTFRGW